MLSVPSKIRYRPLLIVHTHFVLKPCPSLQVGKIDEDNLLLLLLLPVPCKISVHIPSSLCVHLLSARNNSRNNKWALGAGCFVLEVECFFSF